MNNKLLLLNDKQIKQKVKRIAYQIIENNQDEKQLFICGLGNRGDFLAGLIIAELNKLNPPSIQTLTLNVSGENEIIQNTISHNLNNATVIIIDDVLNTGKTLMIALNHIFNFNPNRIETCFLAQRNHKMYPVIGDYVGLKLATTFQEHIHFDISNPEKLELYIE